MGDQRPIGIFDSGLGGISVLRTALKMLPEESFVYLGDNANAPYGLKSTEEIEALSFECAHFLEQQKVKAIVIACNTATSAAVKDLRQTLKIPVVSMEPAIKPALEAGGRGKILMMATPATCSLARYQALRQRLDPQGRVIDIPCYGLVEKIEQDQTDTPAFQENLQELLAPYEGMEIDGIVLGCTHYPFVRKKLEEYAQNHFSGARQFYDGREGTIRQLGRVLERDGLRAPAGNQPQIMLHTTGDDQRVLPLMRRLLEQK
jgi:glutamate racemase